VSVCGNCLRWWRHLKRGSGHREPSDWGSCWLDGTRTQGNETCGMHSDLYPVGEKEHLPPSGEQDQAERTKLSRRARRSALNRTDWTRE
jgi:hypothetical protein